MILSRTQALWMKLSVTACLAGAAGFYAGAHQRESLAPVTTKAAPASTSHGNGFKGPMATEILRIVDGDTFKARVQIWFGQEITTSVRVRGFDAPEIKGRCPEESKAAAQATDMLRDILASGPVTLHEIGPDKYFGRVVASVHVVLRDGVETDVAQMMIAAGMGRPYNGGTRGGWCEQVARK